MSQSNGLDANRKHSTELFQRLRGLQKVRPAILGSFLMKVWAPSERRRVLAVENGLRIYTDPFTHLGQSILGEGGLEHDTEQVLREHLREGDVFLDIGANEGYFTALAGTLVGRKGLVIAVEPQSRLRDLIEINLRLNGVERFQIFLNALGGADGEEGVINLWPDFNTGASSIAKRYRFSSNVESFRFISTERVLSEAGTDHFDFVKVDVEGFEGEVVGSLKATLERGGIQKLYLDYHRAILAERGVDPREIHRQVLACGYEKVAGDDNQFESYLLYRRAAST